MYGYDFVHTPASFVSIIAQSVFGSRENSFVDEMEISVNTKVLSNWVGC